MLESNYFTLVLKSVLDILKKNLTTLKSVLDIFKKFNDIYQSEKRQQGIEFESAHLLFLADRVLRTQSLLIQVLN